MPKSNHKVMDLDKVETADYTDLGPAEMAEALGKLLSETVQATGLFELVEMKVAVGQIHLLGRVAPEKEKSYIEAIGKPLMRAVRDGDLGTLFFGKPYFLKNDSLKYGWQLSIGGDDLHTAVKVMCEAIQDAMYEDSPSDPDVIPMLGAPEPLADPRSGKKGVSPLRG